MKNIIYPQITQIDTDKSISNYKLEITNNNSFNYLRSSATSVEEIHPQITQIGTDKSRSNN